MGTDPAGDKIKDPVKLLAPLLQDKSISAKNKIRLILLHIINKGGDTQSASLTRYLCLSLDLKPVCVELWLKIFKVTFAHHFACVLMKCIFCKYR